MRKMHVFGEEVLTEVNIKKLEIGQCATLTAIRAAVGNLTPGEEVKYAVMPAGHRMDGDELRATYHTFQKVFRGAWMYKGKCFIGDTVERGMDLIPKKRKEKKDED